MLKKITINSLLAVASLLVLALVLELAARIYTQDFAFRNILEDHISLLMSAYPTRYDELLGWVSQEGVSEHNQSGVRITILENGVRSNGVQPVAEEPAGQRPILAIGDSYTFGFEVSDDETWPAILEQVLGRRVINGGVFAYGMDQSLIRAKQLIDRFDPDTLIFSFIPDDIWRCQISARSGVNKPFFNVVSGDLVLQNSPVPRPALTDHGVPGVRSILGYSVFAHHFIMRYGNAMWWLRGDKWHDRQVHSDKAGDEIACLIIKELDALAGAGDLKIYLLAQYGKNIKSGRIQRTRKAIRCADPQWLTVVDTLASLTAVRNRNRQQYRGYFTEGLHMTYEGNRFVAMELKHAMEKSGALTDRPLSATGQPFQ